MYVHVKEVNKTFICGFFSPIRKAACLTVKSVYLISKTPYFLNVNDKNSNFFVPQVSFSLPDIHFLFGGHFLSG